MGAGYILSWDLVKWVAESRNGYFLQWPEDQAVGELLFSGGKGKNFIDLGQQVMDHPSVMGTDWSRDYGQDVILVHRLKDISKLGDSIEYFLGDGANSTRLS
jgi:hypothetical protein